MGDVKIVHNIKSNPFSLKHKKDTLRLYSFMERGIRFSAEKPVAVRQIQKKEVIFCQFEFVGVHLYGRVQIGKKQVTARGFRYSPCGFIVVLVFFESKFLVLYLNHLR